MNEVAKGISPICTACHQEFDLYYHTPRVVPKCGHTFCEKCITFKLVVKQNRRVFACLECGTEVVIRKSVPEDVPKNIGVIDVVRNIKKFSNQKEEKRASIQTCTQHGRPLELICETCKYQKICSHCALFGTHRNHSFVKQMPATKVDLTQMRSNFQIVVDSFQQFLLPNGKRNIRESMKVQITEGLRKHITNCFAHYYDVLRKKEFELLHQCDNIIINEGGIDKTIDSLIQGYDRFKDKYENQFKITEKMEKANVVSLDSIQQFMNKCTQLHNNLQTVQKHAFEYISKILKEIGTTIMQTTLFKIQEFPFSLKKIVESLGNQDMASPNKRNRMKSTSSENKNKAIGIQKEETKIANYHSIDKGNKTQNKGALPKKSRDTFSHHDKVEVIDQDFLLDPARQSDLAFYKEQTNTQLKDLTSNKNTIQYKTIPRGTLPPKAEKSKINEGVEPYTLQVRSPKLETKNKDGKSVGKELSPGRSGGVSKGKGVGEGLLTEQLKFVAPTKQISFHFLSKFHELLVEVDRQSQLSTLELNSMDINDVLLLYILDYLRGKRYLFQVIKLVRNGITDQGMRMLLSYLVTDNTTQVLNLTSNQLTVRSLDLIFLFAGRNNILRTFYLSNNSKISPFQLRSRRSEVEKYELEIIV